MSHHTVDPPLPYKYTGSAPPAVDTLWLDAGGHSELKTVNWAALKGTYGPFWARLLSPPSTPAVAPTPWVTVRPPLRMQTLSRQSGGCRWRRRRRRRNAPPPWRAAAADGVPPAGGGPARQQRVGRLRRLCVGRLHERRRHSAEAPVGLPLRRRRHPPPPPRGGGSANAAASPGPRQLWVMKPSSPTVSGAGGDGEASAATGVEPRRGGARRSGGAAQRGCACPTAPLASRGEGRADRGSWGVGGDAGRPGRAGTQGGGGTNRGTTKVRQSRLHGGRGGRGCTGRAKAPTAVREQKRCQQAPQTTLSRSAQTCRRDGGVSAGGGGREPSCRGGLAGRGGCGDTFTRMDQSQPPLACKGFTGSSDGARPPPPVTNTRSRRSDGSLVVPQGEKLALPLFMR